MAPSRRQRNLDLQPHNGPVGKAALCGRQSHQRRSALIGANPKLDFLSWPPSYLLDETVRGTVLSATCKLHRTAARLGTAKRNVASLVTQVSPLNQPPNLGGRWPGWSPAGQAETAPGYIAIRDSCGR